MPRTKRPAEFSLHYHSARLAHTRAQLQSETAVLLAQMTKLVHMQDDITLLQKRIHYAKAHGIKTLPLYPTPQELAAHEHETGTRKG